MSRNAKASSTRPSGWRDAASQGVGPLSSRVVCPIGGTGLGDGEDETDLGLRPTAGSLTGGDKDELRSAYKNN